MRIEIPATNTNEDWIRSRRWDLPGVDTVEKLLRVLGGMPGTPQDKLAHFLTLPAAKPMPPELRAAVEEFIKSGGTPSTEAAAAKVGHLGLRHEQYHHGNRYVWPEHATVDIRRPVFADADIDTLLGHYPGGHNHDQSVHGGGKAKLVRRVNTKGGYTVRPTDQDNDPSTPPAMVEAKTGFAVAVKGHTRVIDAEAWKEHGADHVQQYITDKQTVLEANPRLNLGGWRDADTGNVWLDVTEVVPDRAEAISLGKSRGEQAVFDIEHSQEIDTGGTGDLTDVRSSATLPTSGRDSTPEGFRPSDVDRLLGGVRSEADGTRGGTGRWAAFLSEAEVRKLGAEYVRKQHPAASDDELEELARQMLADAQLAHYPGGHDHNQSKHSHGKDTHGGGVIAQEWSDLPPDEQRRIEAWVVENIRDADGNPMTLEQIQEHIITGQLEKLGTSTEQQQDWYFEYHDDLSALGDQYGFTPDQMCGAMSATCNMLDPVKNIELAENIAAAMSRHATVDYSAADIEKWNAVCDSKRNSPWMVKMDPAAAGTYLTRPDPAHPELPLSPPGIMMSYHGLGKTENLEVGPAGLVVNIKAAAILQGQSPDVVLEGAKQRTFAPNMGNPGGDKYSTHDTWDYLAKLDGLTLSAQSLGPDGRLVRAPVTRALRPGVNPAKATRADWVVVDGPEVTKKGKPIPLRAPGYYTLEQLRHPKYNVSPQDVLQGGGSILVGGKKPKGWKEGDPLTPSSHGVIDNGVYAWLTEIDKKTAARAPTRGGVRLLPSQVQAGVWGVIRQRTPESLTPAQIGSDPDGWPNGKPPKL